MKKSLCHVALLLCTLSWAKAQEATALFHFLQLPVSSHAAALGGDNLTVIDDDLTLAFHNPALLSSVSNRTLNLNYMTYMSDTKTASAGYCLTFGERSTSALTARYVDYGSFDGYTHENISTGTFTAKETAIGLMYSYLLNDSWSGGVTANFIYSKYETFSSIAVGVDLGINYFNPETDFSTSIVIKNLGGQLKTFDGTREKMPLNFAFGLSKRLAHAPFRFSVTMNELQHWNSAYFYNADGEEDNFGELFMKHCILGIDYIPTRNFYISAGYNYRMSRELSGGSGKWEGITAGAGFAIKRIKAGVSYSKLHISSSSLLFNLSIGL